MKLKKISLLALALMVCSNVFAITAGTFYGDRPVGCQYRKRVIVEHLGKQRRVIANVSPVIYFNNVSPETISFTITQSATHEVNYGVGAGYRDVVSFDTSFKFSNSVVSGMGTTLTYHFTPGRDVAGAYAYVLSSNYSKYHCKAHKRTSTIFSTGNWIYDKSWYVYQSPSEAYLRMTRVGN